MDNNRLDNHENIINLNYETIFQEIQYHLLEDEFPSSYLNDLSNEDIFQHVPFSMLLRLKDTMQTPKYHPEGNAWNHTMLVVDEAAKIKNQSNNKVVFMWAALLHDIGKPDTTRYQKGRYTAYEHDIVGAKLAKDFLKYFGCEKDFIIKVAILIQWHMHILYVLKDLGFARIDEMKKQVDIHELAMLGLCDRLGRLNMDRKKEEENIKLFLERVKNRKDTSK